MLEDSRGLHFYLSTLKAALADDLISEDEMAILDVLASVFGLPKGTLGQCWAVLRGEVANPVGDGARYESRRIGDAATYQMALIAALDDSVITEDEWAMLDVLRRVMGIQPEEHALVEESVRNMAANHDEGSAFISRLDRFNTLHPFA